MTKEQFEKFLAKVYEELENKQESLFSDYNIGTYESYWFNQNSKTLQFKNNEKVELEFKIVCIGTWAHEKGTWMWSWANESFTEDIRKDSEELKKLKEITRYDAFEMEAFQCDENTAYEITAISVKHLDALGMYKMPGEKSHLFVALMKE
ncbi:MAG: hypothetical protein N4A57_08115 [Anaeromicrobium sp.]|jgi:hypothetical protein|uniref:DUF6882 domain-containing protein n=1 Tax=Anaeromicrobium sp. TaxID=1929132 RepID=UPI0025DE1A44|nr:DUF6882 domain-containing protein [Anaeromicrobium sp.]MCT4594216.1 hypothetical protein [Anaeromicrobium sp.]